MSAAEPLGESQSSIHLPAAGTDAVPDDVPQPGASSEPGDKRALQVRTGPKPGEPLPIRMLHDRVLVKLDAESAERRSAGGILIPATAQVGRRMSWAWVMATGQHVRQVDVGDRVLFDPAEQAEVELQGVEYILLRERDIHAVAQPDVEVHGTGLYL